MSYLERLRQQAEEAGELELFNQLLLAGSITVLPEGPAELEQLNAYLERLTHERLH